MLCEIFSHCKFFSNLTLALFTYYLFFMRDSIINRKFSYSFHNVTLLLIAINIFVFFLSYYVYPSLGLRLAMSPFMILADHRWYQFVTYMFIHGSLMHLFSNMLGLFIFGTMVEKYIGSKEFLLYYFMTGTLSAVLTFIYYYFTGKYFYFLMGASGAVYAVMLLFAVFFPNAVVYVMGLLPVKAYVLVAAYFLIEFFLQFSYDGIAHITHLFGLVVGLLYVVIRMNINPFRRIR